MTAKPRAGLDRQIVVQAAAQLADENSLHEVSLATLAGRLGVKTPTLYHYVNGQSGLRRELALLGLSELALRLGQSIMGRAGNEALLRLAHAYRLFVNERPGLYAATVPAAERGDVEMMAAQTRVVEIALHSLAGYNLPGEEAVHSVRMLRSLVHGFASLEQSGGFGLPLDLNQTFERLLNVYLHGLGEERVR